MAMYTPQLIDHFQNPRNAGVIHEPDGVGTIGDPECGDFIRIYINVDNNCLSRVTFEACGCPASIATTSVLTELAIGKTLKEALNIDEIEVAEALGGLPEAKIHCSNLGTVALNQAIMFYLQSDKKRFNYL